MVAYLLGILACASADWFLWMILTANPASRGGLYTATSEGAERAYRQVSSNTGRHKPFAVVSIVLLTATSLTWIGLHAWEDYQLASGLQFPAAQSRELLIIVARFDQRGGVGIDPTTRIVERLEAELQTAKFSNVRIEVASKIANEDDARHVGQLHQAVLVIWGWYDAFGFSPYFTIIRQNKQPLKSIKLVEVPAELKDFNFYIRDALPAQMTSFVTFTLGQLYFWGGKYDDALHAFDIAVASLEKSQQVQGVPTPEGLSSLYFFRGYIQTVIKNNSDEGIANYTKRIEVNPGDVVALNNRGIAYSDKGDYQHALDDYNNAISLDVRFAAAYNNRASIYFIRLQYMEALANYNRAIELKPDFVEAYGNRGLFYSITQIAKTFDLTPVNETCELAMEIDRMKALSDEVNALLGLPRLGATAVLPAISTPQPRSLPTITPACLPPDDLDKAIADLDKAILIDPNYSPAHGTKGLVYLARENFDQATTEFNAAINIDPTLALAYWGRAIAYTSKGLKSDAINDYETYLILNPNTFKRADIEKRIALLKGK